MRKGLRWSSDREVGYCTLNEREQLLLDVLRRWLTGWETRNPHYWQAAWQLLCHKVPASTARRILSNTEAFVRTVAADATRTLSFNRPCCGRVTTDERLLLDMMLRPRSVSLRSAVSEIVEPDAVDATLRLGAEIANVISSAAGKGDGEGLSAPDIGMGSHINLTLH